MEPVSVRSSVELVSVRSSVEPISVRSSVELYEAGSMELVSESAVEFVSRCTVDSPHLHAELDGAGSTVELEIEHDLLDSSSFKS